MSFSLFTRSLGSVETNCIVLANEKAKKLIVFDAPEGAQAFVKEFTAQGYTIDGLYLTHGHYDHILGVAGLVALGAKNIFGHAGDKTFYESPQVMSAWLSPKETAQLHPVKITHWLQDGEKLTAFGGANCALTMEVRHTPGHSPGGVVFYIPSEKTLIAGDTIFRESVGRSDLPGGSHAALMASIKTKVIGLEADTNVYPGHGPTTTIGHERAENPYIA